MMLPLAPHAGRHHLKSTPSRGDEALAYARRRRRAGLLDVALAGSASLELCRLQQASERPLPVFLLSSHPATRNAAAPTKPAPPPTCR
jgi:DNA-binding response OmpR family regulator